MLPIPPAALALVSALVMDEEVYAAKPYYDEIGKIWSQGYGFTFTPSGGPINAYSPPLTQVACQALLTNKLLATYLPPVIAECGWPLTNGQLAGLGSLCWNCGPGAIRNSIIPNLARAGVWAGVQAAMQQFTHDHVGHIVPDLVGRRRREGLILMGVTFLPGKRTGEVLGTPTRPPVLAVQAHPYAAPQLQPRPALAAARAVVSPAQSVAPAPQSEADALMAGELHNLGVPT